MIGKRANVARPCVLEWSQPSVTKGDKGEGQMQNKKRDIFHGRARTALQTEEITTFKIKTTCCAALDTCNVVRPMVTARARRVEIVDETGSVVYARAELAPEMASGFP